MACVNAVHDCVKRTYLNGYTNDQNENPCHKPFDMNPQYFTVISFYYFVLQISMNVPMGLVCMATAQMVSTVTCVHVMRDMMVITVIMVCTFFLCCENALILY